MNAGAAKPRRIPYSPLTAKQRAGIRRKGAGWLRHDSWALSEACDLVFNIHPQTFLRWFAWWSSANSETLFDDAVRSVEAGTLCVLSASVPQKEWKVDPRGFASWVKERPDLVGEDRAALFGELFPTVDPEYMLAIRSRVLESTYTTPEFDLALRAIAEF